ncbi:hypothetical protein [Methylobacterium tarhaniae]|uniref:hypothetical protein n=1 Tax=Methylobacterium tarhaniae TaxID=1187852 RepID=UPI000A9E7D27|nr:hypothetical protein [Methylobacterium tarhaniae]
MFADSFLVAVLVHLPNDHEEDAGKRSLEAGFGRVDEPDPPTFADLEVAQAWTQHRLDGG